MNPPLTSHHWQLVKEVLRVRYWQHLVNESLKQKAFKIPIHLAFGHEAIAVAVSNMMKPADQLVLSHRNIAYNLARAGSLKQIYDEYKLVESGVAKGKLGSMNLVDPQHGVVYSSSVLGNNLSVACGLALGQQVLERRGLVILLTGDGGMEEGQFYESLVFARSHDLRMLFVVENNNQSMSSTIGERRGPIFLENLCAAVNIRFRQLCGNDFFQYLSVLEEFRALAVDRSTCMCVEVHLAALNQHAGPTPGWPTDPKNITIDNGLIIRHSPDDPLYVLQQKIGPHVFGQICQEILAERWDA